MKRRLWELLEPARPGDRAGRAFDVALLTLIALNVVAVVAGTMAGVVRRFGPALDAFEAASVAVFTAEYLARVWAAPADPRYAHPLWGRLRYLRTPMALVDLLAVLPAYLPFVAADLRTLRSLRLLRIFRVAKLGRYVHVLRLFRTITREKREELVVTTCVLVLLLLVAASVMYYAEHDAQPEAFSSIPASMWWAVETLTTVGYGDVYPVTSWGRMLGSVVAILGVGFFALPTAILGAAFIEEVERQKKVAREAAREAAHVCPACGRPLDGAPHGGAPHGGAPADGAGRPSVARPGAG